MVYEGLSLDQAVRKGQGKIVLSVSKSGHAQVKQLLIDDVVWNGVGK